MTSTSPPPTLLPGVPASAWARFMTVAVYLTIPVYLGLAYREFFVSDSNASDSWSLLVTIYGGIVFGSVFILGGIFTVRARHEVAAGYTTQWRGQPTLPQLDGRTGAVIRSAGAPYVKKSEWRDRAFAGGSIPTSESSASPWTKVKPSPWSGLLSILPAVLIATVAFPNMIAIIGPKSESYGVRLLSGAVLVIGAIAIMVLIGAAVVARRLRRLQEVAPDELVFVFAKSKGYSDGYISAALQAPATTGYIARGASANASGLSVWEGNPFVRAFFLPWSAVTSVQVDTVPGGNQSNNMVLVTFRTEGDELATLPLAYAKISAFPVPSKSGVRWIVAQLNELRAGKTAPRVL